jgi:hypothetical protein
VKPSDPTPLPRPDSDFAVTVAGDAVDALDDVLVPDAPPVERRPLETLPTIGHIGRYALKYRLGEGGLGTVYAALDPLLTRPVALKTLHLDPDGDNPEALLLHEARAAALLSHPHIVTVHDAGVSDGTVYLAMEMLHGRDLRDLLVRGWRPQVRQAALIVRRIAEALAYAHGRGVVHCDIKPANIFMVGRTSPKVLDFGIARVAQRPSLDTLTLAGGSPYYMAPEQLRGDLVDRRCDVYALGAVLYELLTGRRAHLGATLDEITDAALWRVPAPANALNPRVPPALSAIVEKALAKDVEERHRTARQLARELRVWLGEEVPRRHRPRGRMRRRIAGLALAGVAAVSAGLAAWPFMSEADEAAAAVAAVPARMPMTRVATAARAPTPTPTQTATTAAAMPVSMTSPAVAAAPATTVGDEPDGVMVLAAGPTATRSAPRARKAQAGKTSPARATATPAPAAAAQGVLQLAISPWGQVEVDGHPAGTTPPLNRLDLSAGRHTVVIRNADFPPHTATVEVTADQPVVVKHRFGS